MQDGGLALIVSGQMNNGVSASAWNSSEGRARDTCVGKSTAWGETPGRQSWDVNLGVLCHRGTDVLRGRLLLLLPQLCFGSVDRCPKPLLALCSPILTWLKAGSAHSTPPSIRGLQLAYSWVFLPTFLRCQAYTSHHGVSLWFLKCLLIQAAGSYIISIICFHPISKEFSLTTSSPSSCPEAASSPNPEVCVPCC